METFIYHRKIQYYEIDRINIVHNSRYSLLFEEARTELLEKENYPFENIENEGLFLPMSTQKIKYVNQLHYRDLVKIFVNIGYIREHSVKIEYKIFKDNLLTTSGYSIHAIVDKNNNFVLMPERMRNIFKKYLIKKE